VLRKKINRGTPSIITIGRRIAAMTKLDEIIKNQNKDEQRKRRELRKKACQEAHKRKKLYKDLSKYSSDSSGH